MTRYGEALFRPPMSHNPPTADDSWSDPSVEGLNVRITQGAAKSDVASVDGTGVTCMVDVEALFGPRLRVIIEGQDPQTGAHVRVDTHLTDRDELLSMAHRIIDEYGDDVGSEAAPDPGTASAAALSPTD